MFAAAHPDGGVEWVSAGFGLAGLGVALLASVYLLRSHGLAFSLDAAAAYEEARDAGALDDSDPEALHIGLTYGPSGIHADNSKTVGRMKRAFALALMGLVAEILGLGVGTAQA